MQNIPVISTLGAYNSYQSTDYTFNFVTHQTLNTSKI